MGLLKDDKTPDPPAFIVEWFRKKTAQELEMIEHEGRLLWPDSVKRKIGPGTFSETPCMLRVPHGGERVQAALYANAFVAKEARVPDRDRPITRERAEALVGATLYDGVHMAMLMAFAIREFKAPHAMMWAPDLIIAATHPVSLYDLYDRLDLYSHYEDFRIGELDERNFEALVNAVAKDRTFNPLAVCDASVRERVIVRMAQELSSHWMTRAAAPPPFSSGSSSTSTPD